MKRHKLILTMLVVILLVGGCGLLRQRAQRQETRNRQLIVALVHQDTKQALALVNEGADPNTPYYPPPFTLERLFPQLLRPSSAPVKDSTTAFMLACGEGFPDNIYNCNGFIPENVTLIKAMLAHGADCNLIGSYKQTALFTTILYYRYQTARLLLEHGADVNTQDSSGTTPLMLAVVMGHTPMTRLLLDYGAKMSAQDDMGRTALHRAIWVSCNDRELICLLLAHGADPNGKDKDGQTPLMFAQEQHRPDMVALLRKGTK